jgi:hypothetical protein
MMKASMFRLTSRTLVSFVVYGFPRYTVLISKLRHKYQQATLR